MDTDTCGTLGRLTDSPFPHTCRCARASAHGAQLHGCTCGAAWSDVLELTVPIELSEAERATIAEYLKVRDYAVRMNAFSIDIGGGLATRVGAILERLTS